MAASKSKPKIMRDHDITLALIDIYKGPNGFDMMLLTGAATGYGVATIAELLTTTAAAMAATASGTSGEGEAESTWEEKAKKAAGGALKIAFGPSVDMAVDKYFSEESGADMSSPAGVMGAMFGAAGHIPKTFADLCIFLLILRAIFGTGGMGDVLKGIGEIVPL